MCIQKSLTFSIWKLQSNYMIGTKLDRDLNEVSWWLPLRPSVWHVDTVLFEVIDIHFMKSINIDFKVRFQNI